MSLARNICVLFYIQNSQREYQQINYAQVTFLTVNSCWCFECFMLTVTLKEIHQCHKIYNMAKWSGVLEQSRSIKKLNVKWTRNA